jgi:uncharacterized membrane protein
MIITVVGVQAPEVSTKKPQVKTCGGPGVDLRLRATSAPDRRRGKVIPLRGAVAENVLAARLHYAGTLPTPCRRVKFFPAFGVPKHPAPRYPVIVKPGFLIHWRGNLLAGLAVLLPAVISITLLYWIFGTVSNFTDALLVFLPRSLTHTDKGVGPVVWYWSAVAFALAVLFVCVVGALTRHYMGNRMIAWADSSLMRVPLLNRIYGATKQIKEAFTAGGSSSFRTVVGVEFPSPGLWSIGFVTNDTAGELEHKLGRKMVCVFVPTTPNPTSGFLLMVPEEKAVKLGMTVPDGIKHIISLGALLQSPSSLRGAALPDAAARTSGEPHRAP